MPFEMTFRAYSTLATLMLLQADAASPCLPDAIPVEDRRKIANLNGTGSVPFGLWVLDWDSAVLAAHLVRLLAEEALGYHSAFTGLGGSSPSGLYATAGCRAPNSFYTDPLCSNDPLFVHHASLEIWGMTSLNADSRLSAWPAISPDDVGDMGYKGVDGMYILTREQEKAYTSEGLALEYYRNYNASWRAPHVYFDTYASIDPAALRPCNETRMVDAEGAEHYLALTGDLDGVVNNSGMLSARCWNTSWWFAPSCRNDPMRCIPTITGGSGWAMQEFVQRAAAYNMPLAVAVATTWSSLPRTKRVLPYWWQPDSTFIDLKPSIVMFPPYNEIERAANVKTSMTKDVRLSKWVHNRLVMKAPHLSDFVAQVRITPSTMDGLLAESKRRGGSEPAQVACDWLRTNRHLWKSWIPVASQCASGFGLADVNGTFQLTRTNISTCGLCPSGKYSDPYRDNIGPTHLCKDCPRGKSTPGQGSTECSSCFPGTIAPVKGSTACEACPVATYSGFVESTSCSPCDPGFVTDYPGATSAKQCLCPTGSYRPFSGTPHCLPCPEGLRCMLGTDMRFLGIAGTRSMSSSASRRHSTWAVPLVVIAMCKAAQGSPLAWGSPRDAFIAALVLLASPAQSAECISRAVSMLNCIGYCSSEAKMIIVRLLPLGVIIFSLVTMGGSWVLAAALRNAHLKQDLSLELPRLPDQQSAIEVVSVGLARRQRRGRWTGRWACGP